MSELVAVLAHEIGHYKMKHVLRSTVLSILHMGVMFFLLSVFLSHEGLFQAFFVQQPSVYAGLVFFGMLYAPIELVLSIGMQIVSRRHEYEADRFAVDTFEACPGAGSQEIVCAQSRQPHPASVLRLFTLLTSPDVAALAGYPECSNAASTMSLTPRQTGGAIAVRSTRVSRDAPRRRHSR